MSIWWIDKPYLLGSHNPTNNELAQLKEKGFSVLVSLLQAEEQTPRYDIAYAQDLGYQRYSFPVRDFAPPTIEQLQQFVDLVNQQASSVKVILHCEGGSGRTGTFAAAYWIAKGMTAAEAIKHIRQVKPHAVETVEQQGVLARYEKHLRSQ
jgi:atypical dual specificity phosphatase